MLAAPKRYRVRRGGEREIWTIAERLALAMAAALEPLGVGVAVVDPRALRFIFVSDAFAALLGATRDELLALHSVLDRVAADDATAATACFAGPREARATLRLLCAGGEPVEIDLSTRPFDSDELERGARSPSWPERARRPKSRALGSLAASAPRPRRAVLDRRARAQDPAHRRCTSTRTRSRGASVANRRTSGGCGARPRRWSGTPSESRPRPISSSTSCASGAGGSSSSAARPISAAIVRDVATRFGAEAANVGATIIIDGERTLPGYWDPLRIEQIISNLVSNALKYGEGTRSPSSSRRRRRARA